jgi:hypothetical protein
MNALTRLFFSRRKLKMLDELVKNILFYLDGKTREGYSGGIKMGFEDGRPASLAESTNPDRVVPEVEYDFNLPETIRKYCAGKFYGTLFFIYNKGKITHFYRNRTWQGRVLEELLGKAPLKTEQKPRFTVVVRK